MIDVSLPGFEETWEPDRAREILNQVLAFEPGWEVVDLTLDRIRHKPGLRGIVHFRGQLGHGAERQEFWVAGSIYSDGRSFAQAEKLGRRSSALPPALRSLVAYDGFLGMLWQVFPLDRRLPDLERACADPGLLGFGSLRPIRHRLGLSATVQASAGGQNRYVKFHRQGEARAAVERGRLLARRKDTGFALPEAIDGLEATVTVGIEGISLDRHPALALVADHVAVQLVELHARSPDGLDDVGSTPARRAHRAAGWLRLVVPQLEPLVNELVKRPWPGGGTQLIHGDLKPDHAFISEGELQMIDVESAGRGRGLSDLAQLYVRLNDVEAAERIRDTYFAASADRSEWSGELAMASLQYALFFAQHRPPEWRRLVETRLARALAS